MSEIKEKLHKVVDELPDSISQQVLDYLTKIKNKSTQELKRVEHINKILQEDNEVLIKLDQ
ncbi:MAG: hypothetical protein RH860_01195 [Cytophagales bacterium]